MIDEQPLLPGLEALDAAPAHPKATVDLDAMASAIAATAEERRKSGIIPTPEKAPSEAEEDVRGAPLNPAALEKIRRQSLAQAETEATDTTLDGPALARATLKAAHARHAS